MLAAFSINIRIMGRPNLSLLGEETIFTPLDAFAGTLFVRPLAVAIIVIISALNYYSFA